LTVFIVVCIVACGTDTPLAGQQGGSAAPALEKNDADILTGWPPS